MLEFAWVFFPWILCIIFFISMTFTWLVNVSIQSSLSQGVQFALWHSNNQTTAEDAFEKYLNNSAPYIMASTFWPPQSKPVLSFNKINADNGSFFYNIQAQYIARHGNPFNFIYPNSKYNAVRYRVVAASPGFL